MLKVDASAEGRLREMKPLFSISFWFGVANEVRDLETRDEAIGCQTRNPLIHQRSLSR